MDAPAKASGDSVPGGRGNAAAVCCSGLRGVDGPPVAGADVGLGVSILGNDQPTSPSWVSAEVMSEAKAGSAPAKRTVSTMTTT